METRISGKDHVVQDTWELIQARGWASPGVPHALRVALLTAAIVLGIVACWVLIALTAPSGMPIGPGVPEPGLDL
jgi:hypothetical protein